MRPRFASSPPLKLKSLVLLALLAVAFVHLWTHVERGWMLGIPTIGHGILYEGTTLGDVIALDEKSGRVLWRSSLGANPDETYGRPRGVISSIAVAGREVGLDAVTGLPAWSFSPLRYRGTGGGISTTPAVDSARGLAVIGTGNPTPMRSPPAGADPYTDSVIAFESRSGRWRWATHLLAHDANDFDIFASPWLFRLNVGGRRTAAVGDTLKNSRYVMLDELTGKIIWQRQLVPPMRWMQSIATPASSGATIVVPLFHAPDDGELVALHAGDGAILWRIHTKGIYEAPVIWHRIVLAAEAGGAIAAFALGSGARQGRLRVGSHLYGHGLALDGDTLFIAGRGKFWAYRLHR